MSRRQRPIRRNSKKKKLCILRLSSMSILFPKRTRKSTKKGCFCPNLRSLQRKIPKKENLAARRRRTAWTKSSNRRPRTRSWKSKPRAQKNSPKKILKPSRPRRRIIPTRRLNGTFRLIIIKTLKATRIIRLKTVIYTLGGTNLYLKNKRY